MEDNETENINHIDLNNSSKANEQAEVVFINKLLLEKGALFVEQKFFNIFKTITSVTKRSITATELYSNIFPNLTPSRKGIEKVVENALNTKPFSPLFHSSEYIYNQWLINFNRCKLVADASSAIIINAQSCKEKLEEFNFWVLEYPQLKGSFNRSNIKWDLGTLPLNLPIKYSPRNPNVKKDILEQLEKKGTMQLLTISDSKNKIEIRLEGLDIVLTRKSRYPITPQKLQSWLRDFGVTISLVTATYLIEFGMPYGGNNISLDEILRYTNNGYGVVGLLAFQLALLLNMNDSNQIIGLKLNPLYQSVVLGLARLEYYLNPKICCL